MPPILGIGIAGVFGTGGVRVGGCGLDEGFQSRGRRRGVYLHDDVGQIGMGNIVDSGRVFRGIVHGSGGYHHMSGKRLSDVLA